MRRFSAVALFAALTLAGCGSSQTPTVTAPVAKAPHPTAASNRAAAEADSHRLLSLLVLPTGATRATGVSPPSLRRPAEGPAATPDVVDLPAWWRAKETTSSVIAFIERHPPRGSKKTGSGSAATRGVVQTRFVTFSWPRSDVLRQRWLVVEVAALQHGYAGVRADAQVIWLQPKPASERVPSTARVLTVTRGWPHHKPPFTHTVTDTAKVHAVAALIDRLPVVQPGVVNCPNIPIGPRVTFTFRATRSGPALARASTLASGPRGECPGVDFDVGGRTQRELSAQPSFLHAVGRVLEVTRAVE